MRAGSCAVGGVRGGRVLCWRGMGGQASGGGGENEWSAIKLKRLTKWLHIIGDGAVTVGPFVSDLSVRFNKAKVKSWSHESS